MACTVATYHSAPLYLLPYSITMAHTSRALSPSSSPPTVTSLLPSHTNACIFFLPALLWFDIMLQQHTTSLLPIPCLAASFSHDAICLSCDNALFFTLYICSCLIWFVLAFAILHFLRFAMTYMKDRKAEQTEQEGRKEERRKDMEGQEGHIFCAVWFLYALPTHTHTDAICALLFARTASSRSSISRTYYCLARR